MKKHKNKKTIKIKTPNRYIVTDGEMGSEEVVDMKTNTVFGGTSEEVVNLLIRELNRLDRENISIEGVLIKKFIKENDELREKIEVLEEKLIGYDTIIRLQSKHLKKIKHS